VRRFPSRVLDLANAIAIVALLASPCKAIESRGMTFVGVQRVAEAALLMVVEGCYAFWGAESGPVGGLRRHRRS